MKRLFTLILILFCFAEVKGQILWERIEKDTIDYLDGYEKVLVKDSLIYLMGFDAEPWPSTLYDQFFYSCYNFNGKLKWRKNGRKMRETMIGDFIIDSDNFLVSYQYHLNFYWLGFQKINMRTGDTLTTNSSILSRIPSPINFFARGRLIKDTSNTYTIGGSGPILSRLNSVGTLMWNKNYALNFPTIHTRSDELGDFIPLKKGGYLFSGTRFFSSPSALWRHPVLVKFNADGDTLFSKVLVINKWQDIEDTYGCKIIETRDGDFIFTGRDDTSKVMLNKSKFFLTKVDSLFNIKWTYFNKGILKDYDMTSIFELEDSSFVVLARVRLNHTGNYAIINIDKSGNYIFHRTYSNPFCSGLPMLWDSQILPDGSIIVAGKCKNHGYTYVARVGGYGPPANQEITKPKPPLPKKPVSGDVYVYDTIGRIIKKLEVKGIDLDLNNVKIDLQGCSNGVYIYKLITNEGVATYKKVLISR